MRHLIGSFSLAEIVWTFILMAARTEDRFSAIDIATVAAIALIPALLSALAFWGLCP